MLKQQAESVASVPVVKGTGREGVCARERESVCVCGPELTAGSFLCPAEPWLLRSLVAKGIGRYQVEQQVPSMSNRVMVLPSQLNY